MSGSNTQSLGEVIKALLKTYKLETGLKNNQVISAWEKIVGTMISRHTKSLAVNNKVLFVKLDSPALIHELSYAKTKIVDSLNKEVGEEVIEEVRFY